MDNIYLFYGEDQKSLKEEVNLWERKFLEKYPDSPNLSIINEVKIPELLIEISTPPFLGEKRLVIAYNIYTDQNKTPEYESFLKTIKSIPDTTILLLIENSTIPKNATIIKEIKKIGNVKEFLKSKQNLKNQVIKELQKNDKTIAPNLLEELIVNLQEEPYRILNEARKLSLYSETSEISEHDINEMVRFNAQVSVFKLMDNLATKQIKDSLTTLNDLHESGEDLVMIFHLIIRQVRLLLIIKFLKTQNLNSHEITKKTKLQPFIVNKLIVQVENFSIKKLNKLMTKLLEIDFKMKKGQIKYTKNNKQEFLFELEKFLLTAIN